MLAVDAVNAADVLREAADALREAQTALNVRQDEIDGLNGMLREAHAELADWKRVHGELAHASNETLEGMREVFTERDGLRAEVERLRALLREARIGLYGLGDDAVVARIDSELGEKK
jgi:chromosome segregation ATPase